MLYVRGGGDPFLISEELALLAPELVAAVGKQPLTGIVLDASYFPADAQHSRRRGQQQVLRCLELGARGELQHHQRRAPRQQGRVRREADADHAACDQPVPGARAERPRPHQPEPGPRAEPAIRRRTPCRIHQAGRRQRQRQDLDRIRARGPHPGLRAPPVAPALRGPPRAPRRLEQLHCQPDIPGDRREKPRRSRQPREVGCRSRARCSRSMASPTPSSSRRARG